MKKLQLSSVHKSLGAEMTQFAGWEMPVKYTRIVEEHLAVRNAVGLFDISHMGEISIVGEGALEFLQKVTSKDVSKLGIGMAHYTMVPNEQGGVKDDVVVYHLEEQDYMVVTNAVNATKIYEWFKQHTPSDIQIDDITNDTVLFALQGPRAQAVLQKLTDFELEDLNRFSNSFIKIAGVKALASRSGYTGEDGFELYVFKQLEDSSQGERIWNELLRVGGEEEIKPCGLGARNSLRLEAGLPLYGHELTEEITPLEARLGFTVKFGKGEFIGRKALQEQKEEGVNSWRIGLKMEERGIPREGYKLIHDGKEIGEITSGGFSPVLKTGIAMGYSSVDLDEGNGIMVRIRGEEKRARIVNWPFHKGK
ncbi:hypothetical protein AKJ48_03625 [candidate division MSBL1 archaeon SCGC-AAA261O19]|uniref:Probable aminomethyltransferase n=1 Tax=candidate division MSBL1 archaeon SCGC-AAA261O19 TaxID=1698277 RepID=A0A133VBN4_9EURY|nr:hypothetical protein AKJ48_03625 [candidate division MSBL1 archaeon SCGC-AAA261O19]